MDPGPGPPGVANAGEAGKKTDKTDVCSMCLRRGKQGENLPRGSVGSSPGGSQKGESSLRMMTRAHQGEGRKGTVGRGMTGTRARKHEQAG